MNPSSVGEDSLEPAMMLVIIYKLWLETIPEWLEDVAEEQEDNTPIAFDTFRIFVNDRHH